MTDTSDHDCARGIEVLDQAVSMLQRIDSCIRNGQIPTAHRDLNNLLSAIDGGKIVIEDGETLSKMRVAIKRAVDAMRPMMDAYSENARALAAAERARGEFIKSIVGHDTPRDTTER